MLGLFLITVMVILKNIHRKECDMNKLICCFILLVCIISGCQTVNGNDKHILATKKLDDINPVAWRHKGVTYVVEYKPINIGIQYMLTGYVNGSVSLMNIQGKKEYEKIKYSLMTFSSLELMAKHQPLGKEVERHMDEAARAMNKQLGIQQLTR